MGDAGVKDDDAPKQLGRIMLKRKPARAIVRPRDPATRHAQLVALSERYGVPALDLEQVFGLTGGDIFHGALSLDQLFWARPALGYADYRGPLGGLYHCGSGAHPGGGVTGAPGHNAARAIIADRGRRAWPTWRSRRRGG